MPVEPVDRSSVIARVCSALLRGDSDGARAVARGEYPFEPRPNGGRAYNELQSMRVFLRDRFTDRYTGGHLIFPGTLRLLSRTLPDEFPFHPNWKMTETHVFWWELFPSLDHQVRHLLSKPRRLVLAPASLPSRSLLTFSATRSPSRFHVRMGLEEGA
jgi:hypothetical protein